MKRRTAAGFKSNPRQLCGPSGKWVRVGDPNQAIYRPYHSSPKFVE
jgi:hypothetical protein